MNNVEVVATGVGVDTCSGGVKGTGAGAGAGGIGGTGIVEIGGRLNLYGCS